MQHPRREMTILGKKIRAQENMLISKVNPRREMTILGKKIRAQENMLISKVNFACFCALNSHHWLLTSSFQYQHHILDKQASR